MGEWVTRGPSIILIFEGPVTHFAKKKIIQLNKFKNKDGRLTLADFTCCGFHPVMPPCTVPWLGPVLLWRPAIFQWLNPPA
jgi:hypothetical protein